MHHAGEMVRFQVSSDPGQVFRLFGVGSVHRSPLFVLHRGITNLTFKSNPNGGQSASFHSLAKGLCNTPPVVGHEDQS